MSIGGLLALILLVIFLHQGYDTLLLNQFICFLPRRKRNNFNSCQSIDALYQTFPEVLLYIYISQGTMTFIETLPMPPKMY